MNICAKSRLHANIYLAVIQSGLLTLAVILVTNGSPIRETEEEVSAEYRLNYLHPCMKNEDIFNDTVLLLEDLEQKFLNLKTNYVSKNYFTFQLAIQISNTVGQIGLCFESRRNFEIFSEKKN